MTPRTIEEAKSKMPAEETFDFAETSDFCDFGYVLAVRSDIPAAPRRTHAQPSE